LRIVFINRFFHPDHSATSQILSDLAFEIAGKGTDVRVITSRQRYDEPKAGLPKHEKINNVQIYRVWSTSFGRVRLFGRALDYLTFYLSVFCKLLALLSRGDTVVAKTDPPLLSVVAVVVVKLRGAVLINWLQDLFPEIAVALKVYGVKGLIARFLKWLRSISLKSAKINVVIGERMAAVLISEGISSQKIRVIHNWIDGERVKPVFHENNKLRKEWGLDGKFVIAYSGNMGRAHEFETIIQAVKILKDRRDFLFLFIGDGPKKCWLEERTWKEELRNFIFKPYQPHEILSQSLSTADVHLISLYPELEGLIVPSKFYGIAAVQRPTVYIGDDGGEVPRILREENCGFTVKMGDGEGLAKKLCELSENKELAISMGLNARKAFEKRFDKTIAVNAWKKILNLN